MDETLSPAETSPLTALGLSKTQYAEALLPQPPPQVVEVLRARLRQAKTVNDEIAEFFHERIVIEETYVRSLQRLHRRPGLAALVPLKYGLLGSC
jgi:hypothetical protein